MNRKTLIFILILVVLALIMLVLRLVILKPAVPLQLQAISPQDTATQVALNQPLVLSLNRPLQNSQELLVETVPPLTLTLTTLETSLEATYSHTEPFHPNTTYLVNFKNTQNQVIASSTFTTITLPGDPNIPLQIEKQNEAYYPLLHYIPYKTTNYVITYADKLVLRVRILKGTPNQLLPEITAWITSHNVDPSTHRLDWVTASGSPFPTPAP